MEMERVRCIDARVEAAKTKVKNLLGAYWDRTLFSCLQGQRADTCRDFVREGVRVPRVSARGSGGRVEQLHRQCHPGVCVTEIPCAPW